MQSRKVDSTTTGATAVVCIIKRTIVNGIPQRTLYSANVGDSRAVLCCKTFGSRYVIYVGK